MSMPEPRMEDDEVPPHLLSEPALAEDWKCEEEDAAWAHLQSNERDPESPNDTPRVSS